MKFMLWRNHVRSPKLPRCNNSIAKLSFFTNQINFAYIESFIVKVNSTVSVETLANRAAGGDSIKANPRSRGVPERLL